MIVVWPKDVMIRSGGAVRDKTKAVPMRRTAIAAMGKATACVPATTPPRKPKTMPTAAIEAMVMTPS